MSDEFKLLVGFGVFVFFTLAWFALCIWATEGLK
jgi:hypothetical protein